MMKSRTPTPVTMMPVFMIMILLLLVVLGSALPTVGTPFSTHSSGHHQRYEAMGEKKVFEESLHTSSSSPSAFPLPTEEDFAELNKPIAGVGAGSFGRENFDGPRVFQQKFSSEDPRARVSSANTGYDEDGNSFLSGNAESGYKSEFVVGKDRELIHMSIDLRWLYKTIVNPQHWKSIARFCRDRIKRLHFGYNQLMKYRENALNLLCSVRSLAPDTCNIRFLQCSLDDATQLALKKQRYLVFYIEEDVAIDITPSLETLLFRRVLAGSRYLRNTNIELGADVPLAATEIAELINQHFFMMACYSDHAYAKSIRILVQKYINQLNDAMPTTSMMIPDESYPMLVVLAPPLEDYDAFAQYQASLVSFNYDTLRQERQLESTITNPKKLKKEKKKLLKRKKPVLELPSTMSKKNRGNKKDLGALEVLGMMKIPQEIINFATDDENEDLYDTEEVNEEEDMESRKRRARLLRARLGERLAICEEKVRNSVEEFLNRVLHEHEERLTCLSQQIERAHDEEQQKRDHEEEQERLRLLQLTEDNQRLDIVEEDPDESALDTSETGQGNNEEDIIQNIPEVDNK